MKQALKKIKNKMNFKNEQYVVFEFEPPPGSFFPDLDVNFLVNGESWCSFGAQYDGVVWRVTLYAVPVDADIQLIRVATGDKIDARVVNDNGTN